MFEDFRPNPHPCRWRPITIYFVHSNEVAVNIIHSRLLGPHVLYYTLYYRAEVMVATKGSHTHIFSSSPLSCVNMPPFRFLVCVIVRKYDELISVYGHPKIPSIVFGNTVRGGLRQRERQHNILFKLYENEPIHTICMPHHNHNRSIQIPIHNLFWTTFRIDSLWCVYDTCSHKGFTQQASEYDSPLRLETQSALYLRAPI